MKTERVAISYKSIVFAILFLIGLYLLYLIRDILAGLFIAVMLMAAMHPLVKKLEKYGIPKLGAIWIVYLVFILLIFALGFVFIPPVLSQTMHLFTNLPIDEFTSYFQELSINVNNLEVVLNQLGTIPRFFSYVTSTVSVFFTIFTIAVMTFYLLIERDQLHHHLKWFFDNNAAEENAKKFINKVEKKLGYWIRGELTLMFVIGVMTYIGLSLLGISYALPLALIAGILEILPNIGPTIAAVPAVIIAATTVSWPMAIATAALYILIQQIENIFIVPQIMKKEVGLNPIVTILLLLIGFRLGGVGGAVLAIPVFLVSQVVITEYYHFKMKSKSGDE